MDPRQILREATMRQHIALGGRSGKEGAPLHEGFHHLMDPFGLMLGMDLQEGLAEALLSNHAAIASPLAVLPSGADAETKPFQQPELVISIPADLPEQVRQGGFRRAFLPLPVPQEQLDRLFDHRRGTAGQFLVLGMQQSHEAEQQGIPCSFAPFRLLQEAGELANPFFSSHRIRDPLPEEFSVPTVGELMDLTEGKGRQSGEGPGIPREGIGAVLIKLSSAGEEKPPLGILGRAVLDAVAHDLQGVLRHGVQPIDQKQESPLFQAVEQNPIHET